MAFCKTGPSSLALLTYLKYMLSYNAWISFSLSLLLNLQLNLGKGLGFLLEVSLFKFSYSE